jgi:hypothetical protein
MVSSQPRIVSLAPNDLAGVFGDIRKVAEALGAPEHGARLGASLRERMAAVKSTARRLASRPRVACIEWIEPLMSGGNWMPELVAMAGGTSLFGQAGEHSPWLDWDDLRAADPDLFFVSPCGFDIPRTLAEMPLLEKRPGVAPAPRRARGSFDRRRRQPVLQPSWPPARGEPRDSGGGAPPWRTPAAAPRQRLGSLAVGVAFLLTRGVLRPVAVDRSLRPHRSRSASFAGI